MSDNSTERVNPHEPPHQLFPAERFSLEIAPGFPAIHHSYQQLGDQKDMVCGAYSLTYLLWAYGFTDCDGVTISVDSVAAAAGTAIEPHNKEWLTGAQEAVDQGTVPPERVNRWYPHEYYEYDLDVADEGGTSTKGLVQACRLASDGELLAIPIPAVSEDEVQLTEDTFDTLLKAFLNGRFGLQIICNYNLKHTLAPAGLLGHKYNLLALLTQWDNPDYFRTLNWNVGHFTTIAGRISHKDSNVRYLLIRDSYKSFGWDGYHLQPEAYIREGLVRSDDDRDGGLFLVVPASEQDRLKTFLQDIGLQTGTWDNGSPYLPQTTPFSSPD